MNRIKPVLDRSTNQIHYVGWTAGEPNAQASARTLCGMDPSGMQKTAWFPIGHHKGGVYFGDKVHDECREGLAI